MTAVRRRMTRVRRSPPQPPHARAGSSALRPFLQDRRGALFASVALAVAGQSLMAFLPLLQKVVLDDAIIERRRPLWPWLGLLLGVGTLALGLHCLRRYAATRVSLDIQHDLRLALREARFNHCVDSLDGPAGSSRQPYQSASITGPWSQWETSSH
jgi:ABC-type multidrug transport system fused ATPase/permease subunit